MIDNRSYLGSIKTYSKLGEGSFSEVFSCDYFDSYYAYKEFKDKDYVKFINDRICKLTKHYYDMRFAFPYRLIYEKTTDDYFVGYIMDPKDNYFDLSYYKNLEYKKKIEILKKSREMIEILHNEYKILHTDLNLWNIMYNKKDDKVTLIDFDTYIDLNDKSGYTDGYYNDLFSLYLKHNKIGKDADIFLFNLCCYSFINNVDFFSVLDFINNNDFGDITSDKAINLFKSYKDIEFNKCLKKEYVIDYL